MEPNPQVSADFVIFTDTIINAVYIDTLEYTLISFTG